MRNQHGSNVVAYNEDGYGEHADGSAYDGTGIERRLPLLAGELAHYEIAAGNFDEAARLAAVMRAQAFAGSDVAGARVECGGHPRVGVIQWRADGIRGAAGLGAFGACEAVEVAEGGRC